MIGGSSTSTQSLRSLVGIGSRGQDFLDEAVIRSNDSDSDNKLNSEKQEGVTVLIVTLIGRQIWFVLTDLISDLISAIFWAKNFAKSLAN